jgi:predicted Zn-dependent protease
VIRHASGVVCAVTLALSMVACGNDSPPADTLTEAEIREALGPPVPPGFRVAQSETNRLIDDGKPADAVSVMEKFLQATPNYFDAHFMLAKAHQAQADSDTVKAADRAVRARHLEAAVTHYQRYLDLYKEAAPLDRTIAFERMVRIHMADGLNRPEEADAVSRRMVDEMPGRPAAFKLRAEVLREQRRHGEASVMLLGSRTIVQEDRLDELGDALLDQVRESPQMSAADTKALLDEALAIAEDLLARKPGEPWGPLLKSHVLREQARRLEADETRRRALVAEADRLLKVATDAIDAIGKPGPAK